MVFATGCSHILHMTPLQTPKDFADSRHQRPRSTAPVRAIHSDDGASTPPVPSIMGEDIWQMDIKDNLLVAICSLAAPICTLAIYVEPSTT